MNSRVIPQNYQFDELFARYPASNSESCDRIKKLPFDERGRL